MQSKPKTADDYILTLPDERAEIIAALRNEIKKNLPKGFEQTMQYGMVSYVIPHRLYQAGYHANPKDALPFMSIASQKNFIAVYHMGVYSDPAINKWFTDALFQTNTQIEDYGGLGPDAWYNYSQIGLTLNVPIFSGGQRYYKLQQEKIALNKVDNGFRSLKNGIDLEIRQASLLFENSIATLETQRANMDLASRVAQVTKIKYEQGVGSNIEVVDAENSLTRQAQANFYGAMFDAMLAKVDLDKAYGKLLPIVAESSK